MKRYLALSGALHALLLGGVALWGVGRVQTHVPGAIQVLLVRGEGADGGNTSRVVRDVSARAQRAAEPAPSRIEVFRNVRTRRVARTRPSAPAIARSRPASAEATEKEVSAARRREFTTAADTPERSSGGGPAEASVGEGGATGVSSSSDAGKGAPEGEERDRRIALIRERIQRALVYPLEARRRGVEGTSQVEFDLEGNGRLRSLALAESSGRNLLDRASLDTVRRAQPFPFVEGILVVPVVFRLSDAR